MNTRRHALLIAMVLALVPAACVPEKRVIWSPDGSLGAVRSNGALHLCDPNGVLSPPLVENVADMAWFHNERRLILVREFTAPSWEDVCELWSPTERAVLEQRTPAVRDAIIAYTGSWDNFDAEVLRELSAADRAALMLSVCSTYRGALEERAPENFKHLTAWSPAIRVLQIADVIDRDRVILGKVVYRATDTLACPVVAPDGGAVAFAQDTQNPSTTQLVVTSLETDGKPVVVAPGSFAGCCWTPDSRRLLFAAAVSTEPIDLEPALIAVSRRQVRTETGEVAPEPGGTERLAYALMPSEPSVAVLPAGDVLFAAPETTLPTVSDDLPQRAALFRISPGGKCSRLTSRRAENVLPGNLCVFSVSPGGDQIAIADPDDGTLFVYEVESDQVWTAVPGDDVKAVRIWPTWRSASEVTYTTLRKKRGDQTLHDLVLVKLDFAHRTATRTVLSAAWPERDSVDFLVEGQNPASQPACGAQPATAPAPP